jgi:hypothetical protein
MSVETMTRGLVALVSAWEARASSPRSLFEAGPVTPERVYSLLPVWFTTPDDASTPVNDQPGFASTVKPMVSPAPAPA